MVLEKLKITIHENQYHGGLRRSGVSNTLKSSGSGKSLFLGPQRPDADVLPLSTQTTPVPAFSHNPFLNKGASEPLLL